MRIEVDVTRAASAGQRVFRCAVVAAREPRGYASQMDPSFEKMTPSEQIQHVQDLWDHIAEHPEGVPVSAEMKAELDRRLAAHRADPSTAIPWEQVKAELRRRQ